MEHWFVIMFSGNIVVVNIFVKLKAYEMFSKLLSLYSSRDCRMFV